MTLGQLANGLLVVALLLAGCGGTAPTPSPVPTPETHTISGEIALNSNTINDGNKISCRATGGFDDIRKGTAVVVKDEAGTVIATGVLGRGEYVDFAPPCRFLFFVTEVPVAAFYSIEVSHRGALTYSYAEMVTRGWAVAFTLG